MSTQEVVYNCASFWGVDSLDLLSLCFDNYFKSDLDVVFGKKCDFSAFCFFFSKT